MYLTIHVALDMELAAAAGTETGLSTAVGPGVGRVAAEGQHGGTAASYIVPLSRRRDCHRITLVPQKLFFFNQENLRDFPVFCCCFPFFSFCFSKLRLLPQLCAICSRLVLKSVICAPHLQHENLSGCIPSHFDLCFVCASLHHLF